MERWSALYGQVSGGGQPWGPIPSFDASLWFPINLKTLTQFESMLAHCLRYWPNSIAALGQHLVFAGYCQIQCIGYVYQELNLSRGIPA